MRAEGCYIGGKLKTREQFVAQLASINPDIELLGDYKGYNVPTLFQCKIDGNKWVAKPGNITRGFGCKVCGYKKVSKSLRKPFSIVREEIERAHPNIRAIEPVFDGFWKVKCCCLVDGYEWATRADHVVMYGCAKCSGYVKKTTDDFKTELSAIQPDVEVIGEYVARHAPIRCRCKKDGFEWEPQPGNLLAGWGCPKCKHSRGERRIEDYLVSHNIAHFCQYGFDECRNVNKLLFDFYIPSKRMAIEFDGEQHFRPVKFGWSKDELADERFERACRNDAIKNQYCTDHNICLVRIPYTDFDKIEEILDKHLL
jgi:hypothetical protein PPSC2_p0627